MAWKGLFQHLERSLMNDYHEFKCTHEVEIILLPNYLFITKGTMAPSFVSTSNITATNPKANLAKGIRNVISATTRNRGVGASINGWGHVLTFNLVVEFFQKLQRCKEFQ